MTSSSEIRSDVEASILRGDFPTGSRINENALAARYGVSRTQVRHALIMLERDGLLVFEENRGAMVRQLTTREIVDLYDVRAGLSATAARLACQRGVPEDFDKLRVLQDEMAAHLSSDGQEAYDMLNVAFHEAIFSATHNERLISLHDMISREMRLFVRRGVSDRLSRRRSHHEHQRVLDAIKAGDEAGAATHFESHILAGRLRMLSELQT